MKVIVWAGEFYLNVASFEKSHASFLHLYGVGSLNRLLAKYGVMVL